MATLTDDQCADLRADIGDAGTNQAFSNPELDRLYTRALADDGGYDLAVVYALRQLLADQAKFTDYTAGETSESRSQVFKHLERLLARWERIAGVSGGIVSKGVIGLGLDEIDSSE